MGGPVGSQSSWKDHRLCLRHLDVLLSLKVSQFLFFAVRWEGVPGALPLILMVRRNWPSLTLFNFEGNVRVQSVQIKYSETCEKNGALDRHHP